MHTMTFISISKRSIILKQTTKRRSQGLPVIICAQMKSIIIHNQSQRTKQASKNILHFINKVHQTNSMIPIEVTCSLYNLGVKPWFKASTIIMCTNIHHKHFIIPNLLPNNKVLNVNKLGLSYNLIVL